jgi:hypothetical protein
MSPFLRRWRRRLLLALAVLLGLVGVGYGGPGRSTSRSQLARAVLWGESDVGDYARFPARRVAAGGAHGGQGPLWRRGFSRITALARDHLRYRGRGAFLHRTSVPVLASLA